MSSPPPDQLADLRSLNDRAAFNRWAGIEVTDAGDGSAELSLRWRPEFGQYVGLLHAGMATALLDTACGFAAYTRVGDVLASNVSVCFMAGGAAERFRARGHVVKAGRRQVFTAAELFAVPDEGSHRLIATATTILVPAA